MDAARSYSTYRVKNNTLEKRLVKVKNAYLPHQFNSSSHRDVAAVFINVGPRNVIEEAARIVEDLQCPIILSENDPATVDTVKGSTSLK